MQQEKTYNVTPQLLGVLSIILVYCFGVFYHEEMLISKGWGYDGEIYGKLAQNFFDLDYWTNYVDQYHKHRVLPSVIVYYTHKAFNISTTREHLFLIFKVLNLLLLVGSFLLFWKTLVRLGYSQKVLFLSSFLLFSQPTFYSTYIFYPNLTDLFALFLAILSIYFYTVNYRYAQAIVLIAVNFTWPALKLMPILFLLFPINEEPQKLKLAGSFIETKLSDIVNTLFRYKFSLCLLGALLYIFFSVFFVLKINRFVIMDGFSFFVINLIVNTVLFVVLCYQFIRQMEFPEIAFRSISLRGGAILLVALLGTKSISSLLLPAGLNHFNTYDQIWTLVNSFCLIPHQLPFLNVYEMFRNAPGIFFLILVPLFVGGKINLTKQPNTFFLISILFFAFKFIPEYRLVLPYTPALIFFILKRGEIVNLFNQLSKRELFGIFTFIFLLSFPFQPINDSIYSSSTYLVEPGFYFYLNLMICTAGSILLYLWLSKKNVSGKFY